jgi:hypothetical protein
MTLPVKIPRFEQPPEEYSKDYFESVLRQLTGYMRELNAKGDIEVRGVQAELPVFDATLRPGTLYVDGGIVKVMP